eukprot:7309682-Prorocentrum_lima.AAC.1
MTSSLVGSEMCIRDRCSAPEPAGLNLSAWACNLPDVFRSLSRVSFATVSYTHLTLPTICSV